MPNRMQAAITRTALALLAALYFPLCAAPQTPAAGPAQAPSTSREVTTDDYNQRLSQLKQSLAGPVANSAAEDYRIGPQDLLEISVFEAPELNPTVRVAGERRDFTAFGWRCAGRGPDTQGARIRPAGTSAPKLHEGSARECFREGDAEPPGVGVWCRQEAWGLPNWQRPNLSSKYFLWPRGWRKMRAIRSS